MAERDVIINRIAEALLVDYSSVYYVNAVTSEYQCYSIDPGFRSLQLESEGRDFFANMARDAEKVVHPEDRHIFTTDFQKQNLLREMKDGTMQSIVYRLMIGGRPVYHTLRLIRNFSEGDDYFVFGVINIDKEKRAELEAGRNEKEREVFNQIARTLAERYDMIFYVDAETDHFIEFSSAEIYKSMRIPTEGDDFFGASLKRVRNFVHPDDRDKIPEQHYKETMLNNLKSRRTVSLTYRLVIFGEVIHCRQFEMWAGDNRHILICVENINEEVAREEYLKQERALNTTYAQIAERLAEHYDTIYFVDAETEEYIEFSSSDLLRDLSVKRGGGQFFTDARTNIAKFIYPDDQTMLHAFFNKELLLAGLSYPEVRQIEYRLLVNHIAVYVRLSAMFTKDRRHLLFCVENIDAQMRELNRANRLARRDELTGAKNKNAYQEMELTLQEKINRGEKPVFGIVVCDVNNLKKINDTQGHKAGDACIQNAGQMICEAFAHSPVFRIGGDEFVVVLVDHDYQERDALLAELRAQFKQNLKKKIDPVAATGMAVFEPENDKDVQSVFSRADDLMYEMKRQLKEQMNVQRFPPT